MKFLIIVVILVCLFGCVKKHQIDNQIKTFCLKGFKHWKYDGSKVFDENGKFIPCVGK